MKTFINIPELLNLAQNKKWSISELAERLNVDYSYLTRVIRAEKCGGAILIVGILSLCREEKLNMEDYIFLNKPLSTNNKKMLA